MTNKDYLELPKGEPKDINIGTRFRTKDSNDKLYSIGATISFYEIISINKNGYEFMEKWEKIEA